MILGQAAAGDPGGSIIFDLFAVLATAALVAVFMQRMRLAVIPAYLLAGAVVGPHALGFVGSSESLEAISKLAIILLLFGIGLQLHLTVLKHSLLRMVGVGLGSCFLSVGLGWPVAGLFGLPAPAALVVAMALSLSSTAVVLRIIAQRRELHQTSGRLALSILVVQDMVVMAMLAALPALARWSGTGGEMIIVKDLTAESISGWPRFLLDAAIRLIGLGGVIVLGRLLLPRLLHEAARRGSTEVLMIVSVAIAIAAAVTTQAIGFSLELGAFLAGFVLSGTPFRHHITGQIGPLRDLFAAVFFTTLGMKIDPASLAQWWWVVLLGSAVMIALKAGVIATTVWSFGALGAVAVTVGLTLAQAGEFSLILLDSASAERILSESAAANAIAIVVLSLIVTPALLALGRRLGPLAAGIKPAPWLSSSTLGPPARPGRGPDTPARHVVIGGYGPIGRLVAEGLHAAGIHYTIVEVNPGTVQQQSHRGESIVYGDVSNTEVLRSAGLEHADALVITIPDEEAVLRTCAVARRLAPNLIITARTRTAGRASAAAAHGADHVISDEIAAADAMQKTVLQHFAQDQPPQPPTNVGPAS